MAVCQNEEILKLLSIRENVEKFHLLPKKSLGQNFLYDLNITRKIARASGDLSLHPILEIGPGPGGLTRGLFLEGAQKVIAIEKDARALNALETLKKIKKDNLHIHIQDALTTSISDISTDPVKIIANLPYNISTLLFIKWLYELTFIHSMTLMFQKEVAARFLALPHTKSYGRLSVMSQALCEVKKLFDLPPDVFTPKPKIYSSVIYFQPKNLTWSYEKVKILEHIVQQSFSQRRKYLHNNLKNTKFFFLLQELNIPKTARAENLTVENYVEMVSYYSEQKNIINKEQK